MRKPMSTAEERQRLLSSVGRPVFGSPTHLEIKESLRQIDQRRCGRCKGEGKLGTKEATCTTCEGRGFVWAKKPKKRSVA